MQAKNVQSLVVKELADHAPCVHALGLVARRFVQDTLRHLSDGHARCRQVLHQHRMRSRAVVSNNTVMFNVQQRLATVGSANQIAARGLHGEQGRGRSFARDIRQCMQMNANEFVC